MTRRTNHEQVILTPATWIGLGSLALATIVAVTHGAWTVSNAQRELGDRLTAVETKVDSFVDRFDRHERRHDAREAGGR